MVTPLGDTFSLPLVDEVQLALGVVAGTLLTFIPAAGDYINSELLGSPRNRMIGNEIQANFIEYRDYPAASAMSFMLMAVILVLVFVYIRRAGTEDLV